MNRPVKFRAWDKQIKKFHPEGIVFLTSKGEPFQLGSIDAKKGLGKFVPLDDMEISFSTGMFDIHKKEVFEGDIIRQQVLNTFGSYGPVDLAVMYCAHKGHWALTKTPDDPEKEHFVMGSLEKKGEVVGNVWETPELLK